MALPDSATGYLKVEKKEERMIPDGFNQDQAAACPECGATAWRNCAEMEWFEVHAKRAEAAKPIVAAW